MRKLFKELYNKYKEIINYLIVGVMTTVVSLGIYYVCVMTFLDPKDTIQLQIANIISWIAAVTFSYITNRIFVFKSKNNNYFREIVLFYSARISTLVIDMLCMFLMVIALDVNDKIAKLIVQVIVTVLNYIFSKLFVFRKK